LSERLWLDVIRKALLIAPNGKRACKAHENYLRRNGSLCDYEVT
jgi:hypothetical protein